jgi:hyperosmotically inducible protein
VWRAPDPGGPRARQTPHALPKEISMKLTHAVLAAASALALVQITGCAVARDQQTVGSYIDDTTLTTRVKTRFAQDPVVSALSINVETLKGTVQLSGFAKSETERSTAARLASSTPGVQAVRNDIVVR